MDALERVVSPFGFKKGYTERMEAITSFSLLVSRYFPPLNHIKAEETETTFSFLLHRWLFVRSRSRTNQQSHKQQANAASVLMRLGPMVDR